MASKMAGSMVLLCAIASLSFGQMYVPEGMEGRGSRMAEHWLIFKDIANGGILRLYCPPVGRGNIVRNIVSIETQAGESPDSVAQRMADAAQSLEYSGVPARYEPGGLVMNGVHFWGRHLLAGTETGLGIPPPPVFLSARYDSQAKEIFLHWKNPPDAAYDYITIGSGHSGPYLVVEGGAESCILIPGYHETPEGVGPPRLVFVPDFEDVPIPVAVNNESINIVGYRDYLPSNAGTIFLEKRGIIQQEHESLPFTGGIAPNWRTWLLASDTGGMEFSEGVLPAVADIYVSVPVPSAEEGRLSYRGETRHVERQLFHQRVRATGKSGIGGTYRKFLGLQPGIYRVSLKMNTLDMGEEDEDWSFSLHVSPGTPDGADFTPEQLAGLDPLPDGQQGPEAGRVVLFGPQQTTEGKWKEISTGDPYLPGKAVGDISIPEGVTELIIWVRHTGSETSGVAHDGLILELISGG